MPINEIRAISDALKRLSVGGITAYKGWGRGKTASQPVHASKGTEIFIPEFGDRYILEVIVPDDKKNEVIEIARSNAKLGKIFVTQIVEAYDIPTERKNDQTI